MITKYAMRSGMLIAMVAIAATGVGIYQYLHFGPQPQFVQTQLWFFLNVFLSVAAIAAVCSVADS